MLHFVVALGLPPPPLLPVPAPLPAPAPSALPAASTTSSPRPSPTSAAVGPRRAEGVGAALSMLLPQVGVLAFTGGVPTCSVACSVARSDVAASPSLREHGSLGSAAESGSASGGPGAAGLVSAAAEARRFGAAARALARSSQEMLLRLARKLREREALDGAGLKSTYGGGDVDGVCDGAKAAVVSAQEEKE